MSRVYTTIEQYKAQIYSYQKIILFLQVYTDILDKNLQLVIYYVKKNYSPRSS